MPPSFAPCVDITAKQDARTTPLTFPGAESRLFKEIPVDPVHGGHGPGVQAGGDGSPYDLAAVNDRIYVFVHI